MIITTEYCHWSLVTGFLFFPRLLVVFTQYNSKIPKETPFLCVSQSPLLSYVRVSFVIIYFINRVSLSLSLSLSHRPLRHIVRHLYIDVTYHNLLL